MISACTDRCWKSCVPRGAIGRRWFGDTSCIFMLVPCYQFTIIHSIAGGKTFVPTSAEGRMEVCFPPFSPVVPRLMFWRDLWTSMTTCFMAISGGINWQTVYEPLNQLDASMGKIFIATWPTEWWWKLVIDNFSPGRSGKLDRPGLKHDWRLGGEMWLYRINEQLWRIHTTEAFDHQIKACYAANNLKASHGCHNGTSEPAWDVTVHSKRAHAHMTAH